MKCYNNKFFCSVVQIIYITGLLSFLISMLLRNSLPDFWHGYLEGIAIVGMLLGLTHNTICIVKKVNPYTGKQR